MTKTFLPHLLKRPAAHIVNVSSMVGFLPVPGQTMYGASKAAVKLLTEGLHSELMDTNVSVTVVFPGAIETGISKNSGVETHVESDESGGDAPSFPMTPAPEAARVIVEAMEKDAYRVRIGKDAKMMDRLSRLAPERAAGIIANKMKDLLPN